MVIDLIWNLIDFQTYSYAKSIVHLESFLLVQFE